MKMPFRSRPNQQSRLLASGLLLMSAAAMSAAAMSAAATWGALGHRTSAAVGIVLLDGTAIVLMLVGYWRARRSRPTA